MKQEIVSPLNLCQIEIVVQDLRRSIDFYEAVLGWACVPAEMHDYAVLTVPDDCPYGISLVPAKRDDKPTEERYASRATLYFRVQEPKTIAQRAKEFGGAVIFGPKKLPGYGLCYQIADPDGQRLGLFGEQDI